MCTESVDNSITTANDYAHGQILFVMFLFLIEFRSYIVLAQCHWKFVN